MARRHLNPVMAVVLSMTPALADDDLAKQIANPVADLISVPFQFNYDKGFGPSNGGRFTLNIQPVMPVKLNENWNVIVRTIVPLINQEETAPGLGSHFGVGDTTQSFFFSPRQPGPSGIVWGVGPVFLWPTGSTPSLRSEQLGAGPTAVILKQQHGWTYGILANHIWSSTSSVDHPRVSTTFLQPFINYTFPDTTSLILNTESTYDWVARQWTVPINAGISKIFTFSSQPISLGVMGRYYVVRPENGPTWGVRFIATLLFPTGKR